MLNQLDTLIGFVVVMAAVSLLITVVTQMVSALLGLRGKYLADALEAMMHKIDPRITEQVHDVGNRLSKWILTHPVLSDSILCMKPSRWDSTPGVRWFRKRWQIASAIRPDELFRVLQDVAGVSPETAFEKEQELAKSATDAVAAIKDPAKRQTISDDAKAHADNAARDEENARQEAIEAAKAAAAEQDPGPKAAALSNAEVKRLAAQNAAKVATQAKEIANKACDAIKDHKKAKRFAEEAAMRAAAAKFLSSLYVPPVVQARVEQPLHEETHPTKQGV
jgi:hypothetical protein